MKWLNEDAEDYLSYKEYGDSMGSTQVLLDEHGKFEEALKVQIHNTPSSRSTSYFYYK